MLALWAGCVVFVLVAFAALAIYGAWRQAECSGEARPFLGSGRQTYAAYGCLARDAGPLIALKMRLGIYDPAWRPVIK